MRVTIKMILSSIIMKREMILIYPLSLSHYESFFDFGILFRGNPYAYISFFCIEEYFLG